MAGVVVLYRGACANKTIVLGGGVLLHSAIIED